MDPTRRAPPPRRCENNSCRQGLEARLTAESEGLSSFEPPRIEGAEPPPSEVAVVVEDQRRMLSEHRRTLELQTAALDARIRQAKRRYRGPAEPA